MYVYVRLSMSAKYDSDIIVRFYLVLLFFF
jgi:hypothetical protein